MIFMDDFHGWLSWTIIDYHRLLAGYFYKLISYLRTDKQTNGQTLVLVKSLSRLKRIYSDLFGPQSLKKSDQHTAYLQWKRQIDDETPESIFPRIPDIREYQNQFCFPGPMLELSVLENWTIDDRQKPPSRIRAIGLQVNNWIIIYFTKNNFLTFWITVNNFWGYFQIYSISFRAKI